MNRFFLYLSKTDSDLIKKLVGADDVAGRGAKLAQSSLGLMVFITGILAFASGSYALYTTFQGWKIAAAIGLIYACLIMAFDREIVSAIDRRTVWVRFPLAILIGVAVALPLEMRLLQGRIDKQLQQEEQTENKESQARRDKLRDEFYREKARLQDEVRKYRDEINKLAEVMRREVVGEVGDQRTGETTGKRGRGDAFRAAEETKTENEKLLSKAETNLQTHLNGEQKTIDEANKEYDRGFVGQRYDFLSRFGALERLKSLPSDEGASARKISWMLRLLFIFIELFPAMTKLFAPENVYTSLTETARRTAINALNRSANNQMSSGNPPPPYPPPPFNTIGANPQAQQVNLAGSGIP
jgi:hypothetical protein